MCTVTINWARAEIVFGILLNALEKELYPYDRAKPPERKENLPKSMIWGSVEHARFLFCVCYYMRGGIESDTAIIALSRMHDQNPLLFDPSYFAVPPLFQDEKFSEVMKSLMKEGLNYKAEEVGRHWVINFQKLHRFWNSDPSMLFSQVTCYNDACNVIMHGRTKSPDDPNGFYGFRHKMVSMLIHFLMSAGAIDRFLFPVPVDFHVLRIMVAHGLLSVDLPEGRDLFNPNLLAAARELSESYCKKYGVDPIRLGEALWLLSRTLCHRHPGNKTLIGTLNGRKTILTALPVTWNDAQVKSFNDTCAECPVRKTCLYNVPSGNYYVSGQIIIRGKRSKPLQLFDQEPDDTAIS